MRRRHALTDFEASLRAAEARRSAENWAAHRIRSGPAQLSDFRTLFSSGVSEDLERLVPTLCLIRAARDAGIPSAAQASDEQYLVRQVLSHKPDGALSAELDAGLARLDHVLQDPFAEMADRIKAGIARLTIGPGSGGALRQRLWRSGLPEEASQDTDLDVECWWHRDLIHDWTPWKQACEDSMVESGTPLEEARNLKLMLPLDAVVKFIEDGYWFRA